MKVSVLGAGNGAYGIAFHLVQLGHDVLMHCPEAFFGEIQAVKDSGCIQAVESLDGFPSALHGVSKVSKITTDIKEACEYSHILVMIIPAFGQRPTFKAALPYLNDQHVLLCLPGNFFFLEATKIVKEESKLDVSKDLPFTIVEASTIPYACRKTSGNQVFICGHKKTIPVGVYPSSRTNKTLELIKPLFALELQVLKNVVEAGFCNLNFIAHPTITLYNAGRIEATKGDFLFYKEGLTPGIYNLLVQFDEERLNLGKTMGFNLERFLSVWKKWYGDTESRTFDEFLARHEIYNAVKAPVSLNNRYITEDMSYLLLPILEYFSKEFKVETPVADAIVTSAKYLSGLTINNERNFDNFPRSLKDI